jgi:hypothetical protein
VSLWIGYEFLINTVSSAEVMREMSWFVNFIWLWGNVRGLYPSIVLEGFRSELGWFVSKSGFKPDTFWVQVKNIVIWAKFYL